MERLKNSKNLLAFSGGVDSTALFFMMIEKKIDFDIVIVDYNQRKNSKYEVKYAKNLAKKFNKYCFIKQYKKDSFSEKKARDFRYKFFKYIVKKYNYQILITAHQLNDQLEWFLMQLGKGAGLYELIGLNTFEKRKYYNILRPILNYPKNKLKKYLDNKNIKYFIDKSNFDTKYKRNFIRSRFANEFLKYYQNGVKNSFDYLKTDIESLKQNYNLIFRKKKLSIYKYNKDVNIAVKVIDLELKKRGILLSKPLRDEIIRQKEITLQDKISLSIVDDKIWIAPKKVITMDKKFKELYRVQKIPKNIRGYLYNNLLNIKLDFDI